LILLTRK